MTDPQPGGGQPTTPTTPKPYVYARDGSGCAAPTILAVILGGLVIFTSVGDEGTSASAMISGLILWLIAAVCRVAWILDQWHERWRAIHDPRPVPPSIVNNPQWNWPLALGKWVKRVIFRNPRPRNHQNPKNPKNQPTQAPRPPDKPERWW